MGESNLRSSRRKPLHLLQLHLIPRRIADHRVKTTTRYSRSPILPNTGKRHLPVHKTLLGNLFTRFGQQFHKPLCPRHIHPHLGYTRRNLHGIAEQAGQKSAKGNLILLVPYIQPLECVNQRQKRIQWLRARLHICKQFCRTPGLLNLRIGQFLNQLHRLRGSGCPLYWLIQKQGTTLFHGLIYTLTDPASKQTVATPQMMIQKTQRRARSECVQPQRHLSQFHCHRILIHSINAPLEHHTSHNVPVIELCLVYGPLALLGVGQDRLTNGINALSQRRNIARAIYFGHCCNDVVGKIIHQTNQKVPRSHCWIANFQIKQFLCWIDLRECLPLKPLAHITARDLLNLLGKSVHTCLHQWLNRLLENQAHESIRRVITPRPLPCKHIRAHHNLAPFAHDLVFEQPLVNRPQLLNAQVAVIDIPSTLKGKRVNHIGHHLIAQPNLGQKGCTFPIKQAAVIRWQTNRGIPLINGTAKIINSRIIACSGLGEHIISCLTIPNVIAYPAQTVIIITIITHRQQVAILGVQNKKQAIEQHQGCIAHLRQGRIRRNSSDGTGQIGKSSRKDHSG